MSSEDKLIDKQSDKRKRGSGTSTSEMDSSMDINTGADNVKNKVKQKKKKGRINQEEMSDIDETSVIDIRRELKEISKKLSNVITKNDGTLKDMITEVINQVKIEILKTVENKIEVLESNLFDKQIENDKLREDIGKLQKTMESQMDKKNQEIKDITSSLEYQAGQLNDLEQYGRRSMVRITGIPEEGVETAEETTRCIIKEINAKITGLNLTENDIDISHRLGKKDGNRSRPIIAKFVSRIKRNSVLRGKRYFKGSSIYINEDLTKFNQQALMNVKRSLNNADSGSGTSVWSRDGQIYYKTNDGHIKHVPFKEYKHWSGNNVRQR